MNRRSLAWGAVLAAAVIGGYLLLPTGSNGPTPSSTPNSIAPGKAPPPPAPTPTAPPSASSASVSVPTAAASAPPYNPADFPLVAALNAPGSTITRDLDLLQQLFDAWRTNFPREGNPVGENSDITAALLGENRLGLALVPKGHPALNAQGELCDRWGTPFRFHQLSGEKMEVRSAGPDRRFATADDAIWTPQ